MSEEQPNKVDNLAGGEEKSDHINLKVVNQVCYCSSMFVEPAHHMNYDDDETFFLLERAPLMWFNLQDNSEVYFKIKKNTALRKLMEAYAQRQGLSVNSIRFLYDGNRLLPDQTPKQVCLEFGLLLIAC
jgi:hypothetical protein